MGDFALKISLLTHGLGLLRRLARWLGRRRARAHDSTRRPRVASPLGVWLSDTVQYHH